MKVQIATVFEAVQWWKDGDHPAVKPGGFGTMINRPCSECGKLKAAHGNIPFESGAIIVCPGDWVVNNGWLTRENSNYNTCEYNRYAIKAFEQLFKEYKP